MLKKYCTYFLLFSAYAVLLCHSMIPHHHRELTHIVQDIDSDDEHQAGHDDEDTPINSAFSHLQHQFGTQETTYIVGTECKDYKAFQFVLPDITSIYKVLRIPPKIISPPDQIRSIFNTKPYNNFYFRGPPARA